MKLFQSDNFLPPELLALAQFTAFEKQDHFMASEVIPPRPDVRQSMVLDTPHMGILNTNLREYLMPMIMFDHGMIVRMGFNLATFRLEIQMTRHGAGQFFRVHRDNGEDNTVDRKISFVIYFSLTGENRFTGGALKIYDGMLGNMLAGYEPLTVPNPRPTVVLPLHNSCVWFPSSQFHEVSNVTCGSDWQDGRFTINGWIHG